MEEVIARFPHLAEYIFNSLSNKTLADCRKVNKAWKGFIDSERFYKKFYKKRIEDEKRRQQSASIQNLQKLLPHHQGEKLSKAMILQHTAEYIYQLEQEKTRLVSQNSQLERLYKDHQQQCLSSQSSENSGRQNGSSNNTMSPKLKRQKLISNPSNLGGSKLGGSNPRGSNPGSSNPRGSNLGGSNPGSSNPGGSNQGGSNPAGSNPGSSNPGGSNPGGSKPGGTNSNHNNSNQNPNTAAAPSDSELSLLDQLMNEQRLRIRLEARIKTLEKQVASVASNKDPKIL